MMCLSLTFVMAIAMRPLSSTRRRHAVYRLKLTIHDTPGRAWLMPLTTVASPLARRRQGRLWGLLFRCTRRDRKLHTNGYEMCIVAEGEREINRGDDCDWLNDAPSSSHCIISAGAGAKPNFSWDLPLLIISAWILFQIRVIWSSNCPSFFDRIDEQWCTDDDMKMLN